MLMCGRSRLRSSAAVLSLSHPLTLIFFKCNYEMLDNTLSALSLFRFFHSQSFRHLLLAAAFTVLNAPSSFDVNFP
jgi:hypothetical protein